MSSDTAELDGLRPLIDGFGGVVVMPLDDGPDVVAVAVVGASVVTVAANVVAVDTTTTVDFTVGVLTIAELIILAITGGDVGLYGSVTSMDL